MLYSVKSTNLPATGCPGDIWYATDTRQAYLVLSSKQLFQLSGLLGANPVPVVGPQGPQGNQGNPGQGLTWRGTYNSGNSYAPNDLVEYSDGSTYICVKQVGANSGNAPGNTEYWNLVAQSGIQYKPGLSAAQIIAYQIALG